MQWWVCYSIAVSRPTFFAKILLPRTAQMQVALLNPVFLVEQWRVLPSRSPEDPLFVAQQKLARNCAVAHA